MFVETVSLYMWLFILLPCGLFINWKEYYIQYFK